MRGGLISLATYVLTALTVLTLANDLWTYRNPKISEHEIYDLLSIDEEPLNILDEKQVIFLAFYRPGSETAELS